MTGGGFRPRTFRQFRVAHTLRGDECSPCRAHVIKVSLIPLLLDCPPTSPVQPVHRWRFKYPVKITSREPVTLPIFHLLSPKPNTMSAPSFLQLQTRAAHPSKRRQDQSDTDTQVSASRSSPRSSTESSPWQSPSTDWARCSRCHRSVSIDGSPPSMTGISIGINSYYCERCAKLVGYMA